MAKLKMTHHLWLKLAFVFAAIIGKCGGVLFLYYCPGVNDIVWGLGEGCQLQFLKGFLFCSLFFFLEGLCVFVLRCQTQNVELGSDILYCWGKD